MLRTPKHKLSTAVCWDREALPLGTPQPWSEAPWPTRRLPRSIAAAPLHTCAHLFAPRSQPLGQQWLALGCRDVECGDSCPGTSKETVLSPAASDGKSKNDSPPKQEWRIDEKQRK